jgi:sialate O-acetylesterase
VGMVAAVDLSMDDPIHVDTQDLKRLGIRLANLACSDLFPRNSTCAGLKRGPRPVSAALIGNLIHVTFSGVNGRLVAQGRVGGFTLQGPNNTPLPILYKARLDASDPTQVLLDVQGTVPKDSRVWYGQGTDPYCNLRDEADMAAPVFVLDVHTP